MKGKKHIHSFNEHQENLNISDVRSSEINTFKIETSIGIIEIPEDAINKEIGNSKEEWVSKLKELYDFVSIYVDLNKDGWLFIELSDGYYGSPEYKIIY
jgi:hypothetical protein